jgi:ubiquinone/menaquinone biosynthesis C-methylase UbiE
VKRTDYAKVAPRYDDNETRKRIPVDDVVASFFEPDASASPRAVLDLACGTGNYLDVQTRAFPGRPVTWFGLDASDAMLSIARAKVPGVDLRIGRAEALPYADATFDYVITSFAFHHFEHKQKVLDEMARVLKPKGALRVVNIAPPLMQGWWVYRFFPTAFAEDEKRFWSTRLLCHELEQRGFDATLRLELERSYLPIVDVLADVERRELSQLAIMSDDEYARGLARIRRLAEENRKGRGATEIALYRCSAMRSEEPSAHWP